MRSMFAVLVLASGVIGCAPTSSDPGSQQQGGPQPGMSPSPGGHDAGTTMPGPGGGTPVVGGSDGGTTTTSSPDMETTGGPVTPVAGTGSATATGTAGGVSITPSDAAANVVLDGTGKLRNASIYISDHAGLCAAATQHAGTRQAGVIELGVSANVGQTLPLNTPIALSVGTARTDVLLAFGLVTKSDDSCHPLQTLGGTSVAGSSVTFTSASAQAVAGSYTVRLQDGSAIMGTFNAAVCAASLSASTTSCL